LGLVSSDKLPSSKNNKNDRKDNEVRLLAESDPVKVSAKSSVFDKLGSFIQKAMDCCRE